MFRQAGWIVLAGAVATIACSGKKKPVEPAVCDCPHQGDLNGDSLYDVRDLLRVIVIVNYDSTDVVDVACPHVGRSDVNCDCVVDMIDVYYLMDFVFKNGPPPCDPCEPRKGCPLIRPHSRTAGLDWGDVLLSSQQRQGAKVPCPQDRCGGLDLGSGSHFQRT